VTPLSPPKATRLTVPSPANVAMFYAYFVRVEDVMDEELQHSLLKRVRSRLETASLHPLLVALP
jgi:hypothetical protein